MNSTVEIVNQWGSRLLSFGWPMLWQSSLLIAVVWMLDVLLARKIRASVRYALWLVALVKLLLPPTLALPTGAAWWLPHARPAAATADIAKHSAFSVTYNAAPPQNAPASTYAPKPKLTGPGWILLAYSAVVAGLLLLLVVRWRQVAGKVRTAAESEKFADELQIARQLAGSRSTTRLKLVDGQMSPAVCGLIRPVILLPQALVEKLSASQLRAVLLHEMLHLRRGDVWVNCAQAMLQIFYWWHPLLWLANARIRRVREEAVDDTVMLALADEAESYPPTLLEVAKLALHAPLPSLGLVGILESRQALRQRIERLLNFRTPGRTGITVMSVLGIAAFAAAAVPMGQAPPPALRPASDLHGLIASDSAVTGEKSDTQVTPNSGIGASATPVETNSLLNVLTFDDLSKETNAYGDQPGAEAHFVFNLTNISPSDVTITSIVTSCGCTVARLPARPWVLHPQSDGQIPVTMRIAGKSGVLAKTVTVKSDQGSVKLTVKTVINTSPNAPEVNVVSRFVELPLPQADAFWTKWAVVRQEKNGPWSVILDPDQAREAWNDLKRDNDNRFLSEGEITTLAGREAHISLGERKTFLLNMTSPWRQTNAMPLGAALDVTPFADPAQDSLRLQLSPELQELLGYEDPNSSVLVAESPTNTPLAPHFRFRHATADVRLSDGYTVALGRFTDKEIVFHDGKLRPVANSKNSTGDLMVFVTIRLMDASGQPLHPELGPSHYLLDDPVVR